MKTKVQLIILSLFAVSCFESCKDNTTGNASNNQQGTDSVPYRKEYKIPVADIKNMVDKYRKERQEIINNNADLINQYGQGFQDTRSVWFSLEELKRFVSQVEREVKENNLKINVDGLRMYFAVYPAKSDSGESDYLKSIVKEYRNHASLFMVPTYYDEQTKTSIDFDPYHMDGNNKPMRLSALKNGDSLTSIRSYNALNHAALCPPSCPVSGTFLTD